MRRVRMLATLRAPAVVHIGRTLYCPVVDRPIYTWVWSAVTAAALTCVCAPAGAAVATVRTSAIRQAATRPVRMVDMRASVDPPAPPLGAGDALYDRGGRAPSPGVKGGHLSAPRWTSASTQVGQSTPSARARPAASVRVCTSSLPKMWARWAETVFWLMNSRPAI